MHISDALTELGHLIGLPDLALNDIGLCRVVFDTTLVVDFEGMRGGRALNLSAVVGKTGAEQNGERFYQTLLQANLLGTATGGAHFSVSPEDQDILFERTLEMEAMDFTGFSQAVESFVNHLEGWQGQLDSLRR